MNEYILIFPSSDCLYRCVERMFFCVKKLREKGYLVDVLSANGEVKPSRRMFLRQNMELLRRGEFRLVCIQGSNAHPYARLILENTPLSTEIRNSSVPESPLDQQVLQVIEKRRCTAQGKS